MSQITIYTDGACHPNPGGPGGYGAVIIQNGKELARLSEGYRASTNNRMEMAACIKGLQALYRLSMRAREVTVISDSKYVVQSKTQWVKRWINNRWRTGEGLPVKNQDLWQILMAFDRVMCVDYQWVKGHNGNEWNEVCDQLAVAARTGKNLKTDLGYEQ